MKLGQMLASSAQRHPEVTALVVPEGRRLTYGELDDAVDRVAGNLEANGTTNGDSIGLFTDNCVEQVIAYIAIQRLGAVAIPVNHRLASSEFASIISEGDADVLIFDAERKNVIADVKDELSINRYICVPPTKPDSGGVPAWSEPFSSLSTAEPLVKNPTVDPDEVALMMHTSGTTGRPKLVEITHRAQWTNSLSCVAEFGFTNDDCVLHVAPLSHSAGYLNLLLPAIHIGATNVVLSGSFEPITVFKTLESEQVTMTLCIPTHLQLLRKAASKGSVDISTYDYSALQMVFTSGASLPPTAATWTVESLCQTLINVYGLTESTGLLSVAEWTSDANPDAGASYDIGEPFIDCELRLVRPDGDATDVAPDEVVPPGERGQLIARAPKLMEGYHNRSEATATALRDGWLYTGDVAVQQQDSRRYELIDRTDNLIISGGENVYPSAVERILSSHPGIAEAGVLGEPDDTLGERIVAYVVSIDSDLTVEEIDRYWREDQDKLANFKRPRAIHFVDELPRNESGKLLREQLRVIT